MAIAAGSRHSLALDGAGRVIAWGNDSYGQSSVPEGLSNVVAVAAGAYHNLALTAEGHVWAWGAGRTNGSWPSLGQSIVPENLSNVVAIAAYQNMSAALTSDGNVVAWGAIDNGDGDTPAYVPPWLDHAVDISLGLYNCFALLGDGTFVHWTSDEVTAQTRPSSMLTNLNAIAAGGRDDLALTANGGVLRWPAYWRGSRFEDAEIIPGLGDVAALVAGNDQSIVIRRNGSVWTDPVNGSPPGNLTNVIAIASGGLHGLALLSGTSTQGLPPQWMVPPHWMAIVDYPMQRYLVIKNGANGIGVTGLPDGLSFDPVGRRIVGIPSQAGDFQITLWATNDTGIAGREVSIHVRVAKPLMNPPVLSVLGLGLPFESRIPAHYASGFHATGLPPGLTLDAATGIIGGTPLQEGEFLVSLLASNRNGSLQSNVIFRVTSVTASSPTVSPIPAGIQQAIDVSIGYDHSLVANADGRVIAWNDYNYENSDWYGRAAVPAALTNVIRVAAGYYHSLALSRDGTVVAWGAGNDGRTGYPHYEQSMVPVGLAQVTAISAGWYHSLALTRDGTVVAWGAGREDRTGWPNYGQSAVPQGLTHVIGIAAGEYHSLAITADRRVVQWGYNALEFRPPADLSNVVAVSAGWQHSLALKADGTVTAWGDNSDGQADVPVGLSNVVSIAAGHDFSVALTGDGRFVRWGADAAGDSLISLPSPVPAWAIEAGFFRYAALLRATPGVGPPQLVPNPGAVAVLDEAFHLRILSRNEVTGWGAQGLPAGLSLDSGLGIITGRPEIEGEFVVTVFATNALGVSSQTIVVRINPAPLPSMYVPSRLLFGIQLPVSFPLASYYTESISMEGLPPGLTYNAVSKTIEGTPTATGLYNVTVIASNSQGTVTNRTDLQTTAILAWGQNPDGQTNVPPIVDPVVSIAAGTSQSLALTAAGKVIGWGGFSFLSAFPPGLSNVVALAAGSLHNLALTRDGTVVGWGLNGSGQATAPNSLSNVVAVATGYEHSLALTASGRVVAWGRNSSGEGTVPDFVSNSVAVAIAAGNYHNIVLMTNGQVINWGRYWDGFSYSLAYVPSGLSNVVTVVAGGSYDAALLKDGRVVAWGRGFSQTNVPSQLSNVVSLVAKGGRTLAVRADGRVGGWGYGTATENNGLSTVSNVVALAVGDAHMLALLGQPETINPPLLLEASAGGLPGNMQISFPTQAGRVYVIERAGSILSNSWSFVTLMVGDGGLRSYSDPAAGAQRFYRVRILPRNH